MLRFERLRSANATVVLGASAVLAAAVMMLGVGAAGAAAAECLPPPQVLLSSVARVAGTGSKVWADMQAVQQSDAAQGTSGPGQVVQDLLDTAARDGYQWDCAGNQVIAPANAPPRTDLPTPTTAVPAPSVPGSAATTPGATDATGGPTATASGSSGLAAPASRPSRGGGLSTVLLVALAAGSGLLVVLVVRRQLSRR